ncbi:MAG: hypothetical protein BGO67_04435 [Alphaproteobacteria bacterium 41-28]|nr:MAG: hypothetical protein BGO67_04435 [Alphaproteobacteria bacterium 41-28]
MVLSSYFKIFFSLFGFILFVSSADAMEKRKGEKDGETKLARQKKKLKIGEQDEIKKTTIDDLPDELHIPIFYFVASSGGAPVLSKLGLVCKQWFNFSRDHQLLGRLITDNLPKSSLKIYRTTQNHLDYFKGEKNLLGRLYTIDSLKKTKAIFSCIRLLESSENKNNPFLVLKILNLLKDKKSIMSLLKTRTRTRSFVLFLGKLDLVFLDTCSPLYDAFCKDSSNRGLAKGLYLFIRQAHESYENLAKDKFNSARTNLAPSSESRFQSFPHLIFTSFPRLKAELLIAYPKNGLFMGYKSPRLVLMAKRLVEEDPTCLKFLQASPTFDAIEGPYIIDRAMALSGEKRVSKKRDRDILREIWEIEHDAVEPEVGERYIEIAQFYEKSPDDLSPEDKFTLSSLFRILGKPSKALQFLKEAAKGALPEAEFCLGGFLASTKNLKSPEHKKALKWREKAAFHGIESAYFEVGTQYWEGRGTPKDIKKAIQNFEKATETDWDGMAEFVLYDFYKKTDPQKARKFLVRATEKKLPHAEYTLGLIHEREGTEAENSDLLQKACVLYRQSAKKNFIEAQYKYACCCRDGVGTQQNTDRAIKWLKQAGYNGNKKALKVLRAMNAAENLGIVDVMEVSED